MPVFVAILLALGAGLLVGSRVHGAREARASYTAYRTRTAKGFGTWIKSLVTAGVAILGTIVLLVLLVNALSAT